MANMSYCRFENTYRDLFDCLHAMNNELSEREAKYKEQLVELCKEIIEEHELNEMSEDEFGFDVVVDEWNVDSDEPEYDGAGFSEEDRIVNGQYRVINSANDEAQDHNVFGENKI